jgi:GH24 family phage-related lysozyme (muramidase)
VLPSARGYREIEASEGWSSVPYWDSIGRVWTAWFGETKGVGPNSPRLTVPQGRVRLHRRFETDYAWALRPFEGLKGFNQNRYDALASFVWNCGVGAVGSGTAVGRALRKRQWDAAARAMLEWCHDGDGKVIKGLLERREREVAMFKLPAKAPAFEGYSDDLVKILRDYDDWHRRGVNPAGQKRLREQMTVLRKRLWHNAQPVAKGGDGKGWTDLRSRKWESLKARTLE